MNDALNSIIKFCDETKNFENEMIRKDIIKNKDPLTIDHIFNYIEIRYDKQKHVLYNSEELKKVFDFILNLGAFLLDHPNSVSNFEKYDKIFNDTNLKKFIIIYYYCIKFDPSYIKKILKTYIGDQYLVTNGDTEPLVERVKSYLKSIFNYYCKNKNRENLDTTDYDYNHFSPNQIYEHIKGESGITNQSSNSGGRTRRKKRRSIKSKKSRKSKQKRSRKARK